MPRRSPVTVARIIERMGRFSPPRHRELVRGMAAELDSIASPVERTRFALGAIAAIGRLVVSGYSRAAVDALARLVAASEADDIANSGGPSVSRLTNRQLLRRHATAFLVSLTSLTMLLFANHAVQRSLDMSAKGFPTGTIVEVLLLALPHTMALTIPMSVFIAVLWVFARLGSEGVLASAAGERHGIRRLVAPVLGAAAVIATLTFVSNAQLYPRANARTLAVLQGSPRALTDRTSERTMTISELREAAGVARARPDADAAAHASGYELEIQRKFALPAACLFLVLAGAAIALRFPHGGGRLVLGASVFVFTGYYFSLLAGEVLADGLVISPFIGMWLGNAFLLAVVLLLAWRPSRTNATRGVETLAIEG